jgi:hypothetical protein
VPAEDADAGNQPDQDDSNKQMIEAEGDGDDDTGDDQQEYSHDAMNGGYQHANFQGQGDFNQMQMMMAMQNGMAPNSMGNFPMMGVFQLLLLAITRY